MNETDAIKKEMEWINVKDKLPKEREPVLILTSYEKMATAYIIDREWVDWMRLQHSYGSVSHWMPLPKPPVR